MAIADDHEAAARKEIAAAANTAIDKGEPVECDSLGFVFIPDVVMVELAISGDDFPPPPIASLHRDGRTVFVYDQSTEIPR